MSAASVQKTGIHILVTLVGMMVAALAAYYILVEFVYPLKAPDIVPRESFQGVTQVRGIISAIDYDALSSATTTLVTVIATTGESKQIIVPLYPGVDCPTADITDVAGLVVGDTIDVKGATKESGEIAPCKAAEHHVVRVATTIPAEAMPIEEATSTATTTLEEVVSEESVAI